MRSLNLKLLMASNPITGFFQKALSERTTLAEIQSDIDDCQNKIIQEKFDLDQLQMQLRARKSISGRTFEQMSENDRRLALADLKNLMKEYVSLQEGIKVLDAKISSYN